MITGNALKNHMFAFTLHQAPFDYRYLYEEEIPSHKREKNDDVQLLHHMTLVRFPKNWFKHSALRGDLINEF